jgi:putative Mg2+ transporter-C (MgtC) family protein
MTAEIIWRILAAVGLGAAVGLEREVAGQPAGLRTNATVALGAALFGVVSTLGFDAYVHPRNDTNIQIDVTRVASQVVVGIGFLGAGLIFRQRGQVRNLTTAASLWVTSAVGLACGVGIIGAAFAATVVLVAMLALLRPLRALVTRHVVRTRRNVEIRLTHGADPYGLLAWVRELPGVTLDGVEVGKDAGAFTLRANVTLAPGIEAGPVFGQIAQRNDVDGLSLEVEQ